MLSKLGLVCLAACCIAMASLSGQCDITSYSDEPVSYVNPFIGTGNAIRPSIWESNGGTYPGASLPFGMVQVTPENYRYDSDHITAFSLINHTSGYPKGSSGDFFIMPLVGNSDGGTSSQYSHQQESASAGYYAVRLLDYDVLAELTATTRTGLLKFTFPESDQSAILLSDLDTATIAGDDHITGSSGGFYYSAKFTKTFRTVDKGAHQLRLGFVTKHQEVIMVKVGFSKTSAEQAINNRQREIADWNFTRIKTAAARIWNRQLKRITIKGATAEQKTLFYTALYHVFLDPHIVSDVDSTVTRYSELSPWDTFRSKHPLLTLLEPERQKDMVLSALEHYRQTGQLDVGPMTGSHNVAIIADSYVKGITGIDDGQAYHAMSAALLKPPYARADIAQFLQHGFVPSQSSYSVTKTLEYAYDYWAMAQMAKALGNTAEQRSLMHKAKQYRALFNPESRFMTAKTLSGRWSKGGYREGDKWAYNWFVPHDIQGLINLSGGDEAFSHLLQRNFAEGHYVHDNEPPMHQAYLFNYAGKPWLSQYWVSQLRQREYASAPGGLPGNDDLGALSAWYVFSALGFYPVTPASPTYVIGSPAFEQVTVHLHNGKTLQIRADNVSRENVYIRSLAINGRTWSNTWIRHSDLLAGGQWRFSMGGKPDKLWGTSAGSRPPSLTTQKPSFVVSNLQLSSGTVGADQQLEAAVSVDNQGKADGSVRLDLYVDDQRVQSHWVLVNAGQKLEHRFALKLYQPGKREISVNDLAPVKVSVKADQKARFVYSAVSIPSPPLSPVDQSFTVSARVKNVGSFVGTQTVSVYVDDKVYDKRLLTLQPGQHKTVSFPLLLSRHGVYNIAIADLPSQQVLVYGEHTRSGMMTTLPASQRPVMAFSFDEDQGSQVFDSSALANHGVAHGAVKWVDAIFGRAIQTNAHTGAYISIPEHPQYRRIGNADALTIMAWIKPHDEENFADIISKGDFHVLQVRASNTEINYYSNHWSHGEAYSLLPDNWNRRWHHVAGVSDGEHHKLYIDGKLVAQKTIENPGQFAGSLNYPWNIGRNAENPERAFRGYIDEVAVFDRALSETQIRFLMLSVQQ